MAWEKLLPTLLEAMQETLYMTLWSSFVAYVVGLPLGVLLVVTRKDGIMPAPTFNTVLGVVINFLRSIPFIIMLALLFPATRVVMGTAIGTKSIIFPLFVSAFRRAGDLAMAMESRCYHGGENRTRLRVLKITKNDYLAALGMIVLIALVVLASHVTLPVWNMVKGLFA